MQWIAQVDPQAVTIFVRVDQPKVALLQNSDCLAHLRVEKIGDIIGTGAKYYNEGNCSPHKSSLRFSYQITGIGLSTPP